MISLEDWVTIRNLHARGLSARAIAVELGISRNTVKAALDSPGPRRYSRVPGGNPQLDPLKPEIREMFLEKGFIGTRILEELRLLGYSGSRAPVYRYLATLRPEVLWGSKVTERFETPPGHQGQFDWSEYSLPLGRVLTRIIVFCLILSFSRRKHHYVSLDQTQGVGVRRYRSRVLPFRRRSRRTPRRQLPGHGPKCEPEGGSVQHPFP